MSKERQFAPPAHITEQIVEKVKSYKKEGVWLTKLADDLGWGKFGKQRLYYYLKRYRPHFSTVLEFQERIPSFRHDKKMDGNGRITEDIKTDEKKSEPHLYRIVYKGFTKTRAEAPSTQL